MSASGYNYFNDPRAWYQYDWGPGLRGSASAFKAGMDTMLNPKYSRRGRLQGKFSLSKCRSTRTRRKSVLRQKTVTAPMSRKIDTKYLDFKLALSGIKTTALTQVIVGEVPQGTAESQRIGNDIRLIKYLVSLELIHGSERIDQTFRVVMVRAKAAQTNAVPSLSNIWNTDVNGNYTPLSLRNVNELEDYEILLDQMILMDNNYAASHGVRCKNFEINTCFPQRYSGAGATTVVRNPVFLYVMTNATNTTTGASGQITIRCIYSDI